jgi:thiol-disulfide isomerase/thioredoxin
MVKLYNTYKNKNFTILSVSLDEDPVKWKEAIQRDGLVWKTHVSDLRGWKSGMPQLYGFDGIPFTVLVNPEGKIISLSSLQGKVVLIDFWASWCAPCRKEMPNVVKLYNQYKDKGFTVYSVSLDEDPKAWKEAIKADGMTWPNHVSDLSGWKSPMPQLYGFQGIPYTVLVDKDGKILETGLRGKSLEQKLKELFSK